MVKIHDQHWAKLAYSSSQGREAEDLQLGSKREIDRQTVIRICLSERICKSTMTLL